MPPRPAKAPRVRSQMRCGLCHERQTLFSTGWWYETNSVSISTQSLQDMLCRQDGTSCSSDPAVINTPSDHLVSQRTKTRVLLLSTKFLPEALRSEFSARAASRAHTAPAERQATGSCRQPQADQGQLEGHRRQRDLVRLVNWSRAAG